MRNRDSFFTFSQVFILDFIFFTYYRIIFGVAHSSNEDFAGHATIFFISFNVWMLPILNMEKPISIWAVSWPAALTFAVLYILYGSKKKIAALDKRRHSDSVLWPFLFAFLTLALYGYLAWT